MGLRIELGSLFNARIEFLDRKLFTDYLDDVSTTYIDPALFYKYLNPSVAAIADNWPTGGRRSIPPIIRFPVPAGVTPKKRQLFHHRIQAGTGFGQNTPLRLCLNFITFTDSSILSCFSQNNRNGRKANHRSHKT